MATSGLFKVIAGSNNKTQVVMITRATIVFSSDILPIIHVHDDYDLCHTQVKWERKGGIGEEERNVETK